MKNKKLNQWLWKWHVIAGLICAPFIILLAITGAIYLFKYDYETPRQKHIVTVSPQGNPASFESQLLIANASQRQKHTALVIPKDSRSASEFTKGRFGHKKSTYINPYTESITGKIAATDGFMYKVRKLHGELLLGKVGTLIVEIVASWLVVLLITGIFIWWPIRKWRIQGIFIPRFKQGKKILFRDLHAITAFWISALLLLVLAGAFPWTEVVGNNYKQLQKMTGTGFPITWMGLGITSERGPKTITLDSIVEVGRELNLPGVTTIEFPKGPQGVYSIGNTYYKDLSKQQKVHYDQYSGKKILHQKWSDVGVLMRARMWVMAFHQGQFGVWNWYLMLTIALLLLISSSMAILSYFSKKPKKKWIIPKVPQSFIISRFIIVVLVTLGIAFPLFGISALCIYLFNRYKPKTNPV